MSEPKHAPTLTCVYVPGDAGDGIHCGRCPHWGRRLPWGGPAEVDMTLDRARELLARQVSFGGGYQRNGARLILAEVARDHGQQAVDGLIAELQLDTTFGFAIGEQFTTPGMK